MRTAGSTPALLDGNERPWYSGADDSSNRSFRVAKAGVTGHRHGIRPRSLTFGPIEIAVQVNELSEPTLDAGDGDLEVGGLAQMLDVQEGPIGPPVRMIKLTAADKLRPTSGFIRMS